MNSFYVAKEPNSDDKYYIAVVIIIYRHALGRYPSFLASYEKDTKNGYTTKFAYVTQWVELDKEVAEAKCEELEKEIAPIIHNCEETGDWSSCPLTFSPKDMLWNK